MCFVDWYFLPEHASPFILLTLKDPLEGMEGALLRSVLDIDCINNMTHEQIISGHSGLPCSFADLSAPVLSLVDCIELITRTGQDSHLLSMLGLQSADSELNYQDCPDYDEDDLPTAHIWLEADFQKELELEMGPEETDTEIEPNEETETQTEPKEEQKENEQENLSDVRGFKSFPLCCGSLS